MIVAIAVLLTFLGALGVGLSLTIISDIRVQTKQARWSILYRLTQFFLVGYGVFIWALFQLSPSYLEIIVAAIFCGGGLFAWLLSHLSLQSLHSLELSLREHHEHMLHDPLTGLVNRSYFLSRLKEQLDEASSDEIWAVIVMDLDRFREINDALGYEQGDKLLRQIAPRLVSALGPEGVLARLAGDEFAAMLCVCSPKQVEMVCQTFESVVKQVTLDNSFDVTCSFSFGVACYPEDGEEPALLLQYADIAKHHAKRNQTGVSIYDASLERSNIARLELVSALHRAILQQSFCIYLQPIMEAHSRRTHGFEALVRWPTDNGGWVPPDQFIPLAEQTGQIAKITPWVLEHALEAFAPISCKFPQLQLHINLSAQDLHRGELVHMIASLLDRFSLSPKALMLEITESAMLDHVDQVLESLNRFVELGVGLSVDDFGTGYSSMSLLQSLPLEQLKIDRSFVMNMIQEADSETIVRASIYLAHGIGCSVVAEGVEDENTANQLANLGCDYLQGYHFCRPMPADEAMGWLAGYEPTGKATDPSQLGCLDGLSAL
jgi:diguanylate cyclase (GGDEF)-like protein